MNIKIAVIGAGQAAGVSDYILPVISASPEFEDFSFYAAFADERFAGILVADPVEFGPEILSIGVSPEFCNKGIATALLSYAVSDITGAYDIDMLTYENRIVAQAFGVPGSLGAISRVFEKCGFRKIDEGGFYEMTVSSLSGNEKLCAESSLKWLASPEGKAAFVSLKEASPKMVRAFGNRLSEQELFPGIDPEELDEDLTYFGINDDEIQSCVLFGKETDGFVQNKYLYINPDVVPSKKIAFLLTGAADAAIKKFSGETKIRFWINKPSTEKIIRYFIGDAMPAEEGVVYAFDFPQKPEELEKRFTDDLSIELLDNAKLCCRDCRHCSSELLSCGIYLEKPDGVLDGDICSYYEKA